MNGCGQDRVQRKEHWRSEYSERNIKSKYSKDPNLITKLECNKMFARSCNPLLIKVERNAWASCHFKTNIEEVNKQILEKKNWTYWLKMSWKFIPPPPPLPPLAICCLSPSSPCLSYIFLFSLSDNTSYAEQLIYPPNTSIRLSINIKKNSK